MGRRPFSVSLTLSLLFHRRRSRAHRRQPHRRRSVNRRRRMDDGEIERRVRDKRRKLDDIELMKLVNDGDDADEAPGELEVVSAREETMGRKEEELEMAGLKEEFWRTSDEELELKIRRNKGHLDSLPLSDGGAKLKRSIKRMEAEIQRRKRDKEAYVCEKPLQSHAFSDAAAGLNQDIQLSSGKTHSQFFSSFCSKLELSNNGKIGSCHEPKRKPSRQFVSQKEQTSRDMPFQRPTRLASNNTDHTPVSIDRWREVSALSLSQRSLPTRLIQKAEAPSSINSFRARGRQGKTVVFLDDDDDDDYQRDKDNSPSVEEDVLFDDMPHQFRNLNERFRRISYPSRDDPTSVIITSKDMDCLDPQEYLSTPIMDFYIRFLQLHYLQQPGSPTLKSRCDFHFFNTYFYSKLTEAVSCKGGDDTTFTKFRRWWKGTNIFHKAYILLPIYEEKHWSLIIICIPDKDKETGPIILHLDSLGFHHSPSLFENIKRFIREEWDHTTQESASSDLPWENLPCIEEKKIAVPQQENDYDCGLFVLYFIERFIAEAPQRLCRKDLQMFGRQWFRPTEASALRTKIRSLLIKEFEATRHVHV
uniref:Ubiquitin-like protease family profile domain-containing protein n=1 Tax=Kalanchoe fedtschenkoi TaxID=63787 RepID=A0A7N0TEL7_KALFE